MNKTIPKQSRENSGDQKLYINGEEYCVAEMEPPFYERWRFAFAFASAATSLFIFLFLL